MICNEKGELLNFMITPGDVDDRKPLEYKAFIDFIHGKLFGDKGYISKKLFQRLFVDGIQLITKLKSNMKGCLMSVSDRLLLRKRAIIETVNDELKNIAQVEHSRHRCFDNFIVNLLGAIAAYCLFPKKPCINVQRTIDDAIRDIDATISKLQKVRAELGSSENNLRLATQDTEKLIIRRLTTNNPTMKAKFDEARNAQTAVELKDDEE